MAEANVEALRRGYEALIDSFAGFRVEPEQVVERGEELIAIVHQSGRGRTSGVEVNARLAHIWTIEDGRAVRWEAVADVDEVLRDSAL